MSNPYTNKDFTGRDLSDREDMSDLMIEGLCLSQSTPSHVLPAHLTNTTFIDSNLDNVIVPAGNFMIRCANRRFIPMEDGNDWEIDDDGNPIKILGT